ncbi:hypothetical protein H4V97_000062 [Flavobacterium sp. CG_23.5]|uniref:hypothetical protein n=1 Tax=Flavobacterium sp. CG_23.5 TaxID=2760708 RepID=UPI001AEB7D4C|nr:hypothetical protein [Flavobacterium sp. CG_23.5]MBP2281744.1 hypothetical protein [Flavobacterium sp. CG_23.5]
MSESFDKGKKGEDFVEFLAEKAYLKYWCFANPMDLEGDGKEICDFLILFYDTAIIISVKNYYVNGNYDRFLKKVIGKSTKQLFGAQRKFKQRDKIKLKHEIQGEVEFDTKTFQNIFKITISVGEDFEHYEFVDYHNEKGIVNIFNRETAGIIFNELDTIKDLVQYLKARETLLQLNNKKVCYCREKDLIADFVTNAREFSPTLLDNFTEETKVIAGKWENYIEQREVILKKLEDENSYFIDKMVKENILPMQDGELLAKKFMTMSRFERRVLANNLFELVTKYENEKDFLARRFTVFNGVAFLFIYYPIERTQKEIDQILLYAQQLYAYYKNTDQIVLLAASKGIKEWKFGLFQSTEITQDSEKYLKALSKQLGWFQNEKKSESIISEYKNI